MRRSGLLLLLITACTRPPIETVESVPMPKEWTAHIPNIFELPDDTPWWEACGDAQCIAWIERGMKANPDVKAAIGRLKELGSLYMAAVGQNAPQMQINGFGERFMQSVNAPLQEGVNILVNRWYNSFVLGFAAAWEFDIWGRLEAIRCAAASDFEQARSTLMLQAVSLPAEIANAVITWRFTQRRLDLLERRVKVLERRDAVQQSSYCAGLIDAGAIAVAQQTLSQVRAQIPMLRQSIQETIRRLAVLVGEYPERILCEGLSLDVDIREPRCPVCVPSELLLRRPDVRSAYYQLAAAESRVALAVAQRYPIISLASTLGLNSAVPEKFLQARSAFASIGPQILSTVLDGGNLAAQAEAASHRQAQALANFQSTVLNAFEEVENALNGVYLMRQNLASLRPALEAAQKTKALAQDLYRQGIFSEVKLLDAEENLIVIEDAVLNSETSLQTQWILLARATAVEQTSEPVSSSSRSGH